MKPMPGKVLDPVERGKLAADAALMGAPAAAAMHGVSKTTALRARHATDIPGRSKLEKREAAIEIYQNLANIREQAKDLAGMYLEALHDQDVVESIKGVIMEGGKDAAMALTALSKVAHDASRVLEACIPKQNFKDDQDSSTNRVEFHQTNTVNIDQAPYEVIETKKGQDEDGEIVEVPDRASGQGLLQLD